MGREMTVPDDRRNLVPSDFPGFNVDPEQRFHGPEPDFSGILA
jgi:hypothetical protein